MKKVLMFILMSSLMSMMSVMASITHIVTYDYGNKLHLGTDTIGDVSYITVTYDGLDNIQDPGMPSLPVDYIKFSVPYNATNFTVSATMPNTIINRISENVYPSQSARLLSDTTIGAINLPDPVTYSNGSVYPTQRVWITSEEFLAGENHIVTVAIMPIGFRISNGLFGKNISLVKSPSVQITLDYQIGSSTRMQPVVCLNDSMRNEGYLLTKSIVVNPNNVEDFAPTSEQAAAIEPIPTGFDVLDPIANLDTNGYIYPYEVYANLSPNYDYAIVTTLNLKPALRRILALKRQKGYAAGIVTIEEIMVNPLLPSGDIIFDSLNNRKVAYTDLAGRLRQYLKIGYSFNKGKYVLLAGSNVPYRYITLPVLGDTITLPSDLYYSDFNGDWSINQIDMGAELYLGRILAKDKKQLTDYTDKLLRYELNPGKGDRGYLKKAFYSEGYDMRIRHEVDTVRKWMDAIFPNPTVFRESSNINDKSRFPSGKAIIKELNDTNYAFISLHHHGYPSGLLTYGLRFGQHKDKYLFLWANDEEHIADTGYIGDDTLTVNGLNCLKNKWYPCVCYSIACKTIPFDVIHPFETLSMNFGESFTTGKDFGGPAFIGNTRDGITPNSAQLEACFSREILRGHYNIGKANAFAKERFAKEILANTQTQKEINTDRYVSVVQNLIGDPEMEMWTADNPSMFEGITISRSDNSITVSGISSDSTIISYCSNNGAVGMDTVSTESFTLNNIPPNSAIMLRKHNYIPFIAPMLIQNITFSRTQYVIASDVCIGKSVDSNRTSGNVTVPEGVIYEIEATGDVRLETGFNVEKGAQFAVYPSSF